MADVMGSMALNAELAPESEVRFTYSRPEQPFFNRMIIRLIERLSGQVHLERLYRNWANKPHPNENIFTAAIRLLDIDVDTSNAAWQRVPRKGPVLFIANHPFGVVDGLLMGHLVSRIRPDVKIITHSLLCQAPEAQDYMLPVDFGGTEEAQKTTLYTRRRTIDWLTKQHAVVVFPAGSVATAQNPFSGPALDHSWHPFVAKLARMPGVTTVPVYFEGQNSRLFHILSHIHYALRIALLFKETTRRIGTSIAVKVGAPLTAQDLPQTTHRNTVVKFLRQKTLSLAGEAGVDPSLEFVWPRYLKVD
jgi:putative hemolysin